MIDVVIESENDGEVGLLHVGNFPPVSLCHSLRMTWSHCRRS